MTYARNTWYVASWASKLSEGKLHAIAIPGEQLVFYRRRDRLFDMLMGIAGQAFSEDKVIFEAPNKLIQSTPNPQIMPTANDRGLTIFNGTVGKLAHDEARA